METFDQMQERQRREMGDVMRDQVHSWKALIGQYENDPNKIPIDVYNQWQQQYGSHRHDALLAQHAAEQKAYQALEEGVKSNQPQWLKSFHNREPRPTETSKDHDIEPTLE